MFGGSQTSIADSATFARKEQDEYDPGLPAMTDMVFQLLMVFVLGVGGKVALLQQFQFDRSPVDGHAAPDRKGNQVVMQVVMEERGDGGEDAFKVILDSAPSVAEKQTWSARGQDALMDVLVRCAGRAQKLIHENEEYSVTKIFMAPGSVEYRRMLRHYSAIEELTGSEWLVSMYEAGAEHEQ